MSVQVASAASWANLSRAASSACLAASLRTTSRGDAAALEPRSAACSGSLLHCGLTPGDSATRIHRRTVASLASYLHATPHARGGCGDAWTRAVLGSCRTATASPSYPVRKAHRERKLMAFTPQQVFEVVVDVDRYHEFVPWCLNSSVKQRISPDEFDADLEVGFQMFTEVYTSRVSTVAPVRIHSEAKEGTLLRLLKFTWEFAQGPTAKTSWVTFSTEFEFKNPMYGQAAGLFFEQVVAKMVNAFEERCGKVYNGP